ncbi:hypothetical protein LguiB_004157 [Lonicera macranthoides]
MLALSPPPPPLFSTFGWPLEDPIISQEMNNNNSLFRELGTSDSLFNDSPFSIPQIALSESTNFGSPGGDATVVKKLNHNASERDRRKKINSLYSTLFSLLPASDQTKKLSIPATVSRVVKYIPELQIEVEKLIQKKEELSSRISKQQENSILPQKRRRKCSFTNGTSLSVVSASQISASEMVVQISTVKANKCLLCEALHKLEEDGLLLLNGSSFESFGERVFHNLHFQVQGNNKIECEMLREKLLSMYEKREEIFF